MGAEELQIGLEIVSIDQIGSGDGCGGVEDGCGVMRD